MHLAVKTRKWVEKPKSFTLPIFIQLHHWLQSLFDSITKRFGKVLEVAQAICFHIWAALLRLLSIIYTRQTILHTL